MLNDLTNAIIWATLETIYLIAIPGIIAVLVGIPLGAILFATRNQNILPNKYCNSILAGTVNIVRSIPFIILLVAIIPFTRFLVGTSIGTTAAIVPLSIAAIPFMGRLVEHSLNEVPHGLIEVGLAMGATPLQITIKILIPEALPGIINAITITFISLIGYSAMAGTIGGGGLGDLAIQYGYQRFNVNVMIITILILIAIVQCIQYLGDVISRKYNHR